MVWFTNLLTSDALENRETVTIDYLLYGPLYFHYS